jgi:hypothetical protein
MFDEEEAVLRPLRVRQANALEQARQAVKEGHKRIIIQGPCGFGKTLLSAHLISSALEKRRRPIFTCPAVSLIDQTVKAFEAEGIHDIGVMQAQHQRTDRHAATQVASVQTLVRRERPDVDFMLLDEIHMQFKALNDMLDNHWKDKIAIGLTATPWAKGMGLRWTKLIIPATIPQLIEEGFLTPTDMYIPSEVAVRGNIDVEKGQFTEASASKEMRQSRIVGNVVETWQKLSPREKTFMFCVNREHAREQMGAFIDSGIPFGYIDANTNIPDRHLQFEKMKHGEIAGIASVGCLIAGVDEDVRCISADTEILTPSGWVGIDDPPPPVVASLNLKTNLIEEVPVQAAVSRLRNGDMVSIVSGTYNMRVTDDHTMIVVGAGGGYEQVEAVSLQGKERFRIPVSADTFSSGLPLTDAELRFIAWFITDGTRGHTHEGGHFTTVSIAQSKPDGQDRIRIVLAANGFFWREYTAPNYGYANGRPLTRFNIPRGLKPKTEGKGWDDLAKYLCKDGSPYLYGMSSYQFGVFWEELLWGDGDNQKTRKGRSGRLCVCNPNLLSNLQAWAALAGFHSNATRAAELPSGKTAWNLIVTKKRHTEVKPKNPSRKVASVSREQSCERVWCLQNTNGTLIIRRAGKVAIVGNCIIDAQPDNSEMHLVQKWGRGIRTADSKRALVGLDHAGNNSDEGLGLFWEIYHDHLDMHKESDKEVAYEGDAKPAKPQRCPTCHVLIPKGHAVCIKCGAPLPANSGLVHVDGDLALYGGEKKKVKERQYTMEEKQSWYSGLLWITRERGGADGAAAHRYREKFGVWPNQLAKEPRPPSFEVERFDKHCRIKFIKGKQKAEAEKPAEEAYKGEF